jgi:methyltransferase OMS1
VALKRRQPYPQYQHRPNPQTAGAEAEGASSDSTAKSGHGIPARALTFMGITALTISTYCGYLYTSYTREVSKAQTLNVPRDVSDRYNTTAPTFDADVELSEKAMGLGKKRRDLVQMARGNVLEVSCGTGRNLPFYELGERRGADKDGRASVIGCRTVTFLDLSPQMVAITKEKFEKLHPTFQGVEFQAGDAGCVGPPTVSRAGSVNEDLPLYFDTVLQTMGLCSMPDPAATLRHLGSVTEPVRGQILLLEHGRSHYDWLNRILDNLAPAHADRHGCWWNRDIGGIVRESGLEIVEEKRWHLGTTWRYVLRPKQNVEEPRS